MARQEPQLVSHLHRRGHQHIPRDRSPADTGCGRRARQDWRGGLELALSADFIVTADDTVMWCAEVITGQLPLAGGYQRLASRIGPAAARRMVMLGEPTPVATIPAVADYIVPDDQLDDTALRLATRLSQGPTRSYAAAKSVLKAWSTGGIAAADKLMLDLSIGLFHTEDFQRGLKDPQRASTHCWAHWRAASNRPSAATRPASPSGAADDEITSLSTAFGEQGHMPGGPRARSSP